MRRRTKGRFSQSQLNIKSPIREYNSEGLVEGRTLAMDPQQGAGRPPMLERTGPEEPFCCAFVLSATKDDVICGRIRR